MLSTLAMIHLVGPIITFSGLAFAVLFVTYLCRRDSALRAAFADEHEGGTNGFNSPLTAVQNVATILLAVFVVGFGVFFWNSMVYRNDDQDWQVVQTVKGEVTVRDKPGWYFRGMAEVWTYPRVMESSFSTAEGTDEGASDQSVRVTFNDGGTAQVSTYIRFTTPSDQDKRRVFHRQFQGSTANVTHAVHAHLVNCLKQTAPLMSATQHQSARKAEFTQVVWEQLVQGQYRVRRTTKEVLDPTDPDGEKKTIIEATEIVLDEQDVPVIAQPSPLREYGIEVLQFSVTGTNYDDKTLEQFAAKQTSFLAAQQSIAQREQETQERLMVEEKGLREKAEAEAAANVEKAKAVIAAEQKAEVAEQAKIEAETKASQALEVAKIEKQEAETKAEKELEVAKLERQAADEKAAAIIVLAEAEEKRIELGGAIKESDRVLAEINAERDAKVAEHISKLGVPGVMFIGAGGAGNDNKELAGGGGLQEFMLNLMLLRGLGVTPDLNMGATRHGSSVRTASAGAGGSQ